MRIGIDARFYGIAGPGRYVKNLIESLEEVDKNNDYVIFLRKENFKLYNPSNLRFKKVLSDYSWYSFAEQIFFPIFLYREKLDIVHVPHFNFPVLYFKKLILTIHDLIMHEHSAVDATSLNRNYYAFKHFVYKVLVQFGFWRAKCVIVPSMCVKNEVIEKSLFKIEDKIIVTYEGLDKNFIMANPSNADILKTLSALDIQKPYILYIGSSYPHKNLKDLIITFQGIVKKNEYIGSLVVLGKRDEFAAKLKSFVGYLGLKDRVYFPSFIEGYSYISDVDLINVIRGSDLLVFPSLKEGFSLTPLEALSQGIFCSISDICAHREIYGDLVFYFNPKSISDMENVIIKSLRNKPAKDKIFESSKQLIKKYNWKTMATQTLELYEKYKKI